MDLYPQFKHPMKPLVIFHVKVTSCQSKILLEQQAYPHLIILALLTFTRFMGFENKKRVLGKWLRIA